MRLIDAEMETVLLDRPERRESAARRLLASGELGAHLLRLAEGAAREHLALLAQQSGGAGEVEPADGGVRP